MSLQKISYIRFLLFLALIVPVRSAGAEEVKGNFLYALSDATGTIRYNWVQLSTDPVRHEVYVVNPVDLTIRIFNDQGMEVYSFGDDLALGYVSDLAVDEQGDLLVLTVSGAAHSLVRGNYRGEPSGKIELKNFPPEYAGRFSPRSLAYRDGRIYLVDKEQMKVAVADRDGRFETGYDLAALLKVEEKKRLQTGIVGFGVDSQGNLLFTVPTLFTAGVLSPDGKLKTFGSKGSAPGKFNIAGGIAADDKGYIYVADTLRCVVMVFDREFTFKTEFGYRGNEPDNLIAPMDIVAMDGRVYVTQSRSRGVSVFRVSVT
jgi:DNA-binding beta-propeller fold protein YncE